jgi:hypothetical protein
VSTAERPQSFANHRAIPRAYWIVAALVLIAELVHRVWIAVRAPEFANVWGAVVVAAVVVTLYAARSNAQRVQDRVIRLEMRLRLERLLGAARRADIQRLGLKQLVALRFASDAELPALVDEVLAGKLATQNEIKRRVKDWQADWLRV